MRFTLILFYILLLSPPAIKAQAKEPLLNNHEHYGNQLLSVVTDFSIKKTAIKKNELVILTYNVRNCRGLDNKTDYIRVADIIKRINPHLVAIQELDSATQRSGGVVVLDVLASETKMYPVYGASIPYQGGKYGVGILSREKPLKWRSVPLPGREENRSVLIVEFENYIFCSTHFSLTEEDRLKSVEILNSLFIGSPKAVFLAGDFNAPPESEVLTNLQTRWQLLNNPADPTIPADNPRRCIDFIFRFKTENTSTIIQKSIVEKEPVASDHLPVWVKVAFF